MKKATAKFRKMQKFRDFYDLGGIIVKKLRVGIAGLGRLGKVHANNLANKIPGAELVAACSIVPAELEYAQKELGVTQVYTDFNEMIATPDIDAVAIVTTSSEHCWQIAAALDAGKHVFSDKPLGVTLEECQLAEQAVERHPDLTFVLGFMRRFDPSYAYAKKKIEAGAIGTIHVGRTAPHGYHIETEIVGTEGSIRVSPVPAKNLAVLYDTNGVVTECVENFGERFADAYRLEMEEFVDCALTGRKPGVSVYDGTASTKIGFATTEAWKSGKVVAI